MKRRSRTKWTDPDERARVLSAYDANGIDAAIAAASPARSRHSVRGFLAYNGRNIGPEAQPEKLRTEFDAQAHVRAVREALRAWDDLVRVHQQREQCNA